MYATIQNFADGPPSIGGHIEPGGGCGFTVGGTGAIGCSGVSGGNTPLGGSGSTMGCDGMSGGRPPQMTSGGASTP
jgi:hypothetical protein